MRTSPQAVTPAQRTIEGLSDESARTLEETKTILASVLEVLDEGKAEEIVTIDLAGKSSLGAFMVIASGRSDRHVGAIADQLVRKLKEQGIGRVRAEGTEACDWVLVDIGDIIIHVFRPEVRDFYKLEKMWSGERPTDEIAH